MPLGTIPQPTSLRINVGTAAPPATPVGGLVGWGNPINRGTETTEFYNDFPTFTSAGPLTRRKTFRLKWAGGDSGQAILWNGIKNNSIVFSDLLMDGAKGEYFPGIVTQFEPAGPGARQAHDMTVSLEAVGDGVDVGGGFGG